MSHKVNQRLPLKIAELLTERVSGPAALAGYERKLPASKKNLAPRREFETFPAGRPTGFIISPRQVEP